MTKRRRAWLINGLLILGALGLGLAVAEGAVRIFLPQPTGLSHQDRYGLPMHWPGLTRYLPQFGHEVSFNSAGMRDVEHTIEKPAGTYRILLLGDSFMEALQVPFDSSLPARLPALLQRRTGRRIEVINAGVSGWGTDDELRYLTEYGIRYHPDLVLVTMTLHNDLSDNTRQEWHRLEGDSLVDVNPPRIPFLRYQVLQLKGWLSTRFQTYQLWRRVRHGGEIAQVGRQLNRHVVELFREPRSEGIQKSVLLTDRMLGRIKTVTENAGGRVAIVLLPLRYQLSDSMFADLAREAEVPPQEMHIGQPQQLVRPIADSLGIPVIDLLPPFRAWSDSGRGSLYLEWEGHWNQAGHRLAAEITADGLAQAGLVR